MQPLRSVVSTFTLCLAVVILTAPAAVAGSGPVGAYGFEEPTGTAAVDSSGSANAGTLAGPVRSASGRFGAALSFDGVDDRVNVADSASLDVTVAMTVEAWVRPESSGWRTVLLKERPSGLAYALYANTDTGRPSTEIQTATSAESRAPAGIPSSTWTHLASTYDGATLRLYFNGTQVSSRAVSGAIQISSGALRIGGNAIWGEYFRGLIDEVRVYNRALTAGEIQLDMGTAVIPPDAQPPTAPAGLTATVASDDVHLSWGAATDDVGVTAYRVYRDGVLLTTLGPAARSYDDLDRAPGPYRYAVTAVDGAGHAGAASNEAAVTIAPDTTPPTVDMASACNGATVHDYVNLRPSVSDDRGPMTARIELDGATIWGPWNVTSPRFSFDWETRDTTNGLHVMKAVVRDAAGNETVSAPCVWNVHNPAVTVPFSSLTNGQTVRGVVIVRAQPNADGQPLSGWPVNTVAYDLDGGAGGGGGPAPYEWSWDTTKVSNGVHTLKAKVYWMDYGAPRATNTIQVTVDNTVPRPTGVTATVTEGDVHIAWDAALPGSGVTGYRVFRDGAQIGAQTGTGYTDANRPPGTYLYTVAAVNGSGTAGDPSDGSSATVTPDTTPPSLTLQAGCDGRTLSEYVGPIEGDATDERGAVTVRVEVDGTRIWGPTTYAGGTFRFYWDTRAGANGPHLMQAIARDAAGNETVKDCPWTVSNRALSVPITGAADGATVSGAVTVGFQPRADGQPVSASVRLEIDGVTVAQRLSGPYDYVWDTTGLANGLHTLKAEMRWLDYSQPLATSTIQLRVDNVPAAPPGLVAAYGFEGTSATTATDSSPTGATGTISGATSSAGGRFGRALSFDGINDLVTVPDANPLDLSPGMTLEAWVKPSTVSDWRTVLLKERPGSLTYALYAASDTGRPMAEVATGGTADARGTSPLPLATWTHLAVTYDRSTLRLYVDGTQVATRAATGGLLNSAGALRIGGNNVWGEWFKGLIDEVRVYERALTPAEIQADRNRPVVPGT